MIRYRRSFVIAFALIPALALAAPRSKKKRAKKATTTRPAEPAASEPAPTPDEPEASADTAPAPPSTVAPATPAPATTPGAGSATPPAPAMAVEAPAVEDTADVDRLRHEYLALRNELFKSRARASAVSSELYSTRMQIKLTYTTARHYNPAKATIRLDGATVWEDAAGKIGSDDGVRFDGHVAPGRHLVTFRVEASGKDDDTFTSVTETQIVVKAIAGKDLLVAAKARDAGDIAYAWKKGERGTYGLGIDAVVKTVPRPDAGKGAGK